MYWSRYHNCFAASYSPQPICTTVLRRDGIQDNNGLTRGALSFCLQVGVPNVYYGYHSACGTVAVADDGVTVSIRG